VAGVRALCKALARVLPRGTSHPGSRDAVPPSVLEAAQALARPLGALSAALFGAPALPPPVRPGARACMCACFVHSVASPGELLLSLSLTMIANGSLPCVIVRDADGCFFRRLFPSPQEPGTSSAAEAPLAVLAAAGRWAAAAKSALWRALGHPPMLPAADTDAAVLAAPTPPLAVGLAACPLPSSSPPPHPPVPLCPNFRFPYERCIMLPGSNQC